MVERDERRGMNTVEARLPLPPPKGHTHLKGRYGMYPTAEYKQWLLLARGLLAEQYSGDVLTDWVSVDIDVWLSARQRDAHNYTAPVLDLLAGARVQDDRTEANYGKIVHDCPVVIANDRNVAKLTVTLKEVKSRDPHIIVRVSTYTDDVGIGTSQSRGHGNSRRVK